MKNNTKNNQEKGFAMLFAVLVSSVLISISISIFNITLKELTLSSAGRESQFAFYAADSGMECAIYWDFKANIPSTMYAYSISTSEDENARQAAVTEEQPTCLGTNLTGNFNAPDANGTRAITTFEFDVPNVPNTPASYCAKITVTKTPSAGFGSQTVIESRGYNYPCSNINNQNTIERALRVTY